MAAKPACLHGATTDERRRMSRSIVFLLKLSRLVLINCALPPQHTSLPPQPPTHVQGACVQLFRSAATMSRARAAGRAQANPAWAGEQLPQRTQRSHTARRGQGAGEAAMRLKKEREPALS